MTAYYNEIDKKAAAWLRELIKQGHIAPGDVDERSIEDVHPDDIRGYTQCHFFAGIGIWSASLRGAGWPDDRPAWTGSCPCQPFSAAGKREGITDERHLWPAWNHLIRVARPGVILGEQVAGKNGLAWLDIVQTDLETLDYTSGAVPMAAAGFGAPHIRERTYWVASRMADHTEPGRQSWRRSSEESDGSGQTWIEPGRLRSLGGLAHDASSRLDTEGLGTEGEARNEAWLRSPERGRQTGGMGDSEGIGRIGREDDRDGGRGQCPSGQAGEADGSSATNGFWRDADWLGCRDNKFRPVEPGTFPLVNGASARVGRLRSYGNGIVKPQAEEFIKAVMEYLDQ